MSNFKLIPLEERIVLDAAAAATVSTAVIYVDAHAHGANTGTSWSDAYTNLQSALNQAASTPGAEQIWVARGNYAPTAIEPLSGKPSFVIPTLTSIYGGFTGNETSLNQRSPNNALTVLNGDVLGNDSSNPASKLDNAAHVVVIGSAAGTNASVLLDDLTVTNGYASGNGASASTTNGRGGGILSRNNLSLSLNNVTLSNNQALISSTVAPSIQTGQGLGGGLLMSGSGTLTITDSLFKDNIATRRGGAFFSLSSFLTTYVTTTVDNTTFDSNHTTLELGTLAANPAFAGQGGAVMTQGGLNTFTNDVFMHNFTQEVGGALLLNNFSSTIFSGANLVSNCTFIDNSAQIYEGGALFIADHSQSNATLTVKDSIFQGNYASSGSAITIDSVPGMLIHNQFLNNTQKYMGAVMVQNVHQMYDPPSFSSPAQTTISDSYFKGNVSLGGPITASEMLEWTINASLPPPNLYDAGGGAIGVTWNGILQVNSSRFLNNQAPNGGAIAVASSNWWNTTDSFLYGDSPTFTRQYVGGGTLSVAGSTFVNNLATSGNGGAIASKQWTSPADPNYPSQSFTDTAPVTVSVSTSSFQSNNAAAHGGALSLQNTTADLHGNAFLGNKSSPGGGLALYSEDSTINGLLSSFDIINSLKTQNAFNPLKDDTIVIE